MDAELSAIVQNIKSLAEQASQMMQGSEVSNPETTESVKKGQPAGGEPEEKVSPETVQKILKYLEDIDKEPEKTPEEVTKSVEGATGSDSAEERLKEIGEINAQNVEEVAKALNELMGRKKKAQPSSTTIEALKGLTGVVKSLQDEIRVQKEFSTNILKGLGIADEILKINPAEEKKRALPVQYSPQEVAKSLEFIRSMMLESKEPTQQISFNDHHVAKSLAANDGEALKFMFKRI